jgi:hypothetical protein
MKVLNLRCAHDHGFEGWFASEDDFQGQLSRGLLECPVCGDTVITKGLSAPRLNLGASAAEPSDATAVANDAIATPQQAMQVAWMKAVREVMARTEDVGERFAEEARRMHYGEVDERGIRGRASREETEALLEEGIPVLPLPVPKGLKGPLQ